MLNREYADQTCSISRSLEVVGERWSLLIIRDVLLGTTSFNQLVESLGITRTVLTHRLAHLVEHDVLERHLYRRRPERFEYRLTAKGRGLLPVIAHLMWWGDEHYPAPGGPPRLLVHAGCGGSLDATYSCDVGHSNLQPGDIAAVPGPGLAVVPDLAPQQNPPAARSGVDRGVRGIPAGRDQTGNDVGGQPHQRDPAAGV